MTTENHAPWPQSVMTHGHTVWSSLAHENINLKRDLGLGKILRQYGGDEAECMRVMREIDAVAERLDALLSERDRLVNRLRGCDDATD